MTYDKYLADVTTALSKFRTLACMNSVQSKYRSKRYYDRRANVRHYREGEMVYMLKEPQKGKHDAEYVGPCEILGIDYVNHNVKLKKGEQTRVVHMDKLKRAIEELQAGSALVAEQTSEETSSNNNRD